MVKNPPATTEDTGSILGQATKSPYAAEQLGLPATTTEACVPRTCATRPTRNVTTMRRPHPMRKSKPYSALQLEKSCMQQWSLSRVKNK